MKAKRKAKASSLIGKNSLIVHGTAFAIWIAWGIYALGDQYRVLQNMIALDLNPADIASMQAIFNTTTVQITVVSLIWLLMLVGHVAFVRVRNAEARAIRAGIYAQYHHNTARLVDKSSHDGHSATLTAQKRQATSS